MLLADKYRLESLLGEGGMGTVWRARNVVLDVEVAVKLIRGAIEDDRVVERFLREAQASARLQHPAIARTFDYGTTPHGQPFMVMELLKGETLVDRLEAKHILDARELVGLLLPVASALTVAHRAGVIHRDLKPDNIFLVDDGDGTVRPVIMDFGIAKLPRTEGNRPLTDQHALVGTPEYMSPEQLSGDDDIDARSDVWALCVLIYEALAGGRPFHGDDARALFKAILTADPPTLAELGFADSELSAIVQRGLAKSREARWPSVRDLGVALAQWAAAAGAVTDASGVTLARWEGVRLPVPSPRRAEPDTPPQPRVETVAPVRERSTPSVHVTLPPVRKRRSVAVLAASLALVAVLAGSTWTRVTRAAPARSMAAAGLAVGASLRAAAVRQATAVSDPPRSPPPPETAPTTTPASRETRTIAAAAPRRVSVESAEPITTAAIEAAPPPTAEEPAPPPPGEALSVPQSRVPAMPNF